MIVTCDVCQDKFVSEEPGMWASEQDAIQHGWKTYAEAYPVDERMLCSECEPPSKENE